MDLRDWILDDDLSHFVIESAERVDIGALKVNWRGSAKARYHPRMMLARRLKLLKLGMVSIDGTMIDAAKINANVTKIKSVRHDRALALRERLASAIARDPGMECSEITIAACRHDPGYG